jgi:hypothetical protein
MEKRVLYQIILTVVIVALLSSASYYGLCIGLKKTKWGQSGELNYAMNDSTYYNTIFLGSSTIHVAIRPTVFDSISGLHSFNLGMIMYQVTEINMLVKKYIKSHGAPRHIVIGCDEGTLSRLSGIWHSQQYYPFIEDSDFKEFVTLQPDLRMGKYMPPVAMNLMDDELKGLALIGLFNYKNKYDLRERGYTAVDARMKNDLPRIAANFSTNIRGWQLLEETIEYCQKRNVSVTILVPPKYNYIMSDPNIAFMAKLKSLESKYGIRVLDFSDDKRFQSKEMFSDRVHLTTKGAYLFTSVLAHEMSGL